MNELVTLHSHAAYIIMQCRKCVDVKMKQKSMSCMVTECEGNMPCHLSIALVSFVFYLSPHARGVDMHQHTIVKVSVSMASLPGRCTSLHDAGQPGNTATVSMATEVLHAELFMDSKYALLLFPPINKLDTKLGRTCEIMMLAVKGAFDCSTMSNISTDDS